MRPRRPGAPVPLCVLGAALLVASCSTHAARSSGSGGGLAIRPAALAPSSDVPAAAEHAEPFGLPVVLTSRWSVVVRDLQVFTPSPPIPGSAGTPVLADMFYITAPGASSRHSVVTLTDPGTGRACEPGPGPGAPPVVTSGAHAPHRIVAYHVTFLCPETDPGDLLLTVRAGPASLTFYGPVS